jgi:hypothetical protein
MATKLAKVVPRKRSEVRKRDSLRALPRWTGWLAVGIAVLDLVAVPAIFGGNDFMEAVVAGVTTSAGWHVYINDVMGLAFIGWLISVGIAMMRLKPKAVA